MEYRKKISLSLIIALIFGLNLLKAKLIGQAEDWIALIKQTIMVLFVRFIRCFDHADAAEPRTLIG